MNIERYDGKIEKFDVDFKGWKEADKNIKSVSEYMKWVDNLDFDMGKYTSTMRNILKGLMNITAKVGNVIIRFGKILLDILMKVVFDNPNAIAGIVFGFFFGLICFTIPLVGFLLGPIMTPLFTLAGGLTGFVTDFQTKIMAAGVESRVMSSMREGFSKMGVVI
jgi:hypothetical protein